MDDTVTIRPAGPEDGPAVKTLIQKVFDEFVAPHFSPEGVETFLVHVQLQALTERLDNGDLRFLAMAEDRLVGVIEMREPAHISLLFVEKERQRRGLARALIERALAGIQDRPATVSAITVNASPNAVEAYKRLGFVATEEEITRDGIRHVPMQRTLSDGR